MKYKALIGFLNLRQIVALKGLPVVAVDRRRPWANVNLYQTKI